MNTCESEVATGKAKQPCPEEIALGIYDDFTGIFGNNMLSIVMKLIDSTVVKRDIDALITFFSQFSDILDSNNYGLKTELTNSDAYNTARTDLAQKRLTIKKGKGKRKIVQTNIQRINSLTYSLNSSILLRGVLRTSQSIRKRIPAEIRNILEGVERETEKILVTMLDDLENEWKVTVNSGKLEKVLEIIHAPDLPDMFGGEKNGDNL